MAAWKWLALETRGTLNIQELARQLNLRMPKLGALLDALFAATTATNTFAAGATSPSIYGARLWKTNNPAPTTIVALADGQAGDEKTIWAGDANTTIRHSASLYTKTAADITLGANEARQFATLDGTNWREV